jgi:N-acetylated-alpha-linked acidic dipeptidase
MAASLASCLLGLGLLWPQEPSESRKSRVELSEHERFVVENVEQQRCRMRLRVLTAEAHLAGTPADRRTADYVRQQLDHAGFATEVSEYHVLLTWPVRTRCAIVGPKPEELDLRETEQDAADPELRRACLAYHGYSPSGNAEGEVVYANYGTAADFRHLRESGIETKGKVCLIRYGGQFRGLKVQEAERAGACGVLIYSDPEDDGWRQGDVWPDGPWRPDSALQRGSVQFISQNVGDPLTPGTPALKDAPRLSRTEAPGLPHIPSLPISARSASRIFAQLRGTRVPKEWQGSCPFAYHHGPGPVRVRLEVELDEAVRPIWNVHGTLPGTDPDGRYVMVGNHRDSWVHGAIDPSSGTATTLEAMTVLGALHKRGWRPRLSIRYSSWDGEEFGLLGSTEWVEHHAAEVQRQCLAYFNGDAMVSGDRLDASCTPDLVQVLADAAARVDAPDGKGRWLVRWAHGGTRPPVGHLGSGSDYTAFVCRLGVSCLDLSAKGGHGVYHSVFDDFATMERFIDPEFKIHAAMARMLAIATLRFASAGKAPLEAGAWAPFLRSALEAQGSLERKHEERLSSAIATLAGAATDEVSDAGLIALRATFLDEAGIASRPWYRNLLVAPGLRLGYGSVLLPGLAEALEKGDEALIEHEVDRLARRVLEAGRVLAAK